MSAAMRCIACGAEMTLITVDRDDTMGILGFEHHAFKCSQCHDVKWHLVFIRHGRENRRRAFAGASGTTYCACFSGGG